MKYKLLVSDVDDTLIYGGKISETNKRAIKDYIDAGGIFTLASGRMYASLTAKLQELGLEKADIPAVCLNGCMAAYGASGRVIFQKSIPLESALKIMQKCEEQNLYYQIYDFENLYVKEFNDINAEYARSTGSQPIEVGDLKGFAQRRGLVGKIVMMDYPENIREKFYPEFLKLDVDAKMTISHPRLLEALPVGADKGSALKVIAGLMKIPLEQVCAIGDNFNDIEMLRTAGLGAAVGNACPEAKAAADIVVRSNAENGVADLIGQLLAK